MSSAGVFLLCMFFSYVSSKENALPPIEPVVDEFGCKLDDALLTPAELYGLE
jgi:hypothetical protein